MVYKMVDPITLSVAWGALVSIGEQMGVALARTAHSNAVKDGYDFSAAVFDAKGHLVAQGDFSPGHLGAMLYNVKHVLEYFPPDQLKEGDGIILNDPWMGTGHFPDITMVSPVFVDATLVGFVANTAHHVDVGGAVPGSQIVEGVIDYYQEGLRILPVKCWEAGEENDQILRLLTANVRLPNQFLGDLRAQANANRVGAQRFSALARRYGPDVIADVMTIILEKGEASMRQALSELRPGEYAFEDYLDDWGEGTSPIKVKVTARIAGGEITLDFTGSDPQTESGLNSYINYTRAYGICAVRCATVPSVPHNEGVARPINFVVPEGCFFNPKPPAGGSSRATINVRIFDAVMGALSLAAPDRVMAGLSHWSNPNISGIERQSGSNFIFYDLVMGGTGARPIKDGIEAMSAPFNAANIPVEVQEANTPLLVERIELIPDSGGAGKYRGGLGLRKDVRVFGDQLRLVNLTDRCVYAPFGLFGGEKGKPGRTLVIRGESDSPVHSKSTTRLAESDVISFQVSGGGGYGAAVERDVEAVRQDVIKGYVSVDGAAEAYGVVIDPSTTTVDQPATAVRRAAMAGAATSSSI